MLLIEIELHISPKNSALKYLRGWGYDDSRSTPKADEQRKKNLRFCPGTMTTQNGPSKKTAQS